MRPITMLVPFAAGGGGDTVARIMAWKRPAPPENSFLWSAAPDIPTVDEAGLPRFYFSLWYALFAPKRTPPIIVAKPNATVVEALADRAVKRRPADLGQEIFPREQQTPDAL